MSRPRTHKRVCHHCGSDRVRVSAWLAADGSGIHEEQFTADGSPPLGVCSNCEAEGDLLEVELDAAELRAEHERWQRRARHAVAAMIVRAMDVLPVETASHLVSNALGPMMMLPDDPELPDVHDALRGVVERDCRAAQIDPAYPHRYGHVNHWPLLADLDAIWERAHRGEDVSGDALERFRSVIHRQATAHDSVAVRYERGFWHVEFSSPGPRWYRVAEGDETAFGSSSCYEGRKLAEGIHPMLEVAAELCWRALPVARRRRAGAEGSDDE